MTSRDTAAFGRRLTALAIAVSLGLGASACPGGGRDQDRPTTAASQVNEQLQTDMPLAELQGPGGLSLTITSTKRDARRLRHATTVGWLPWRMQLGARSHERHLNLLGGINEQILRLGRFFRII